MHGLVTAPSYVPYGHTWPDSCSSLWLVWSCFLVPHFWSPFSLELFIKIRSHLPLPLLAVTKRKYQCSNVGEHPVILSCLQFLILPPYCTQASVFLCFIILITCTMLAFSCLYIFQNLLSPRTLPFPVFSLSHSCLSPWSRLKMPLPKRSLRFSNFLITGSPDILVKNRYPSPGQVHNSEPPGSCLESWNFKKHPSPAQEVRNHFPGPALLKLLAAYWTSPQNQHLLVLSDIIIFLMFDSLAAKVENCHLRPMFSHIHAQKNHSVILSANSKAHKLQEADSEELRLRPRIFICQYPPHCSYTGGLRITVWDPLGGITEAPLLAPLAF